jgi:HSP20 family molecular chaperone IbpA
MFIRNSINSAQSLEDFLKLAGVSKEALKARQDGLEEKQPSRYPFTDICSDENGILHIEIAAAGFDKDDFEITKEDDLLIIKGTVSKETLEDDEGMKYFQKQIAKRSFVRKIKLQPEYAESEMVDASSLNGILTVSVWPVESVKPKVQNIVVS